MFTGQTRIAGFENAHLVIFPIKKFLIYFVLLIATELMSQTLIFMMLKKLSLTRAIKLNDYGSIRWKNSKKTLIMRAKN